MNAIDQYQKEPDVDRMLSAFFKSEMPASFPRLKMPAGQSNMPMPVADNLASGQWNASVVKSKLALAASVALLVGGCLYVSSQIGEPAERPTAGKGDLSAKVPKELLKAQKEALKNPTMP
jgi:hypothetical protein